MALDLWRFKKASNDKGLKIFNQCQSLASKFGTNKKERVYILSVEIPPIEGSQIVYAELQKNLMSPGYSLIVKKCRFCKTDHVHSGYEGHRSAHCFNRRTGKPLPISGYILKIDWSNPVNQALRKDYLEFLKTKE